MEQGAVERGTSSPGMNDGASVPQYGDQGIEHTVFTHVFLLDSLMNICYTGRQG